MEIVVSQIISCLGTGVGNMVSLLWDYTLGALTNLILLSRNAEKLQEEMGRLRDLKEDLGKRVAREEAQPGMEATSQVKGWMQRVQQLDIEVASFQTSLERQSTLCNCNTGFGLLRLGLVAPEKLKKVESLMTEGGSFTSVAEYAVPDPVEELFTIPNSSIVGGEETLAEVRRYLSDGKARLIGIYGMGGIGKTTLMKMLNNELFKQGNSGVEGLAFDVVIWATVSQEMNVLHIQQQIGDRLGLSLSRDPPAQVNNQAYSLRRALLRKQFLLFLDDVWTEIDLEEIGIPHPGSRTDGNSKIVFTTRSLQVCTDMVADHKVAVRLLDKTKSWQLFRKNLQGDAILRSNPSLQQLAESIVKRCGGLPLSIITVARSMAHKRNYNEWSNAIKALDDSAIKLRGMDKVLSVLKFSFDRLKDEVMRSCLLYCALFPEDQEIGRDELVEYWVGEGLLDEKSTIEDDHIDAARGRGHEIVSCLESACLLERGFLRVTNPFKVRNLQETVRMHDAVRHMALYVSGESFMVMAGKRLRKFPPGKRWGFAQRISFMYNRDLREFPSDPLPNCPNLSTLLLNSTGVGPFVPIGFFESMPALKVLDLSSTGIEEVPAGLCSLSKLQYLNLSQTSIRSLPKELGNLAMLRQLDLETTTKMESVPGEALQRLSNLKVLKMWSSGYLNSKEVVDVRCLETLDQLGDLQIDLGTCRSLRLLVESNLLSGCTTGLCVQKKEVPTAAVGCGDEEDEPLYGNDGFLLRRIIESGDVLKRLVLSDDNVHGNRFVGEMRFQPGQLSRLEYLCIHSFTEEAKIIVPGGAMIASILPNLRSLEIYSCHAVFEDLRWTGGLISLQHLTLNDCRGIEQILIIEHSIRPETRQSPFPKLREMRLFRLPSLRIISTEPLLFPGLEALIVFECPRLKQLPLGPRSAPKLQLIRGTQEWWDALEWDAHGAVGSSDGAGLVFLPRFRRFDLSRMFIRRASRIRRR